MSRCAGTELIHKAPDAGYLYPEAEVRAARRTRTQWPRIEARQYFPAFYYLSQPSYGGQKMYANGQYSHKSGHPSRLAIPRLIELSGLTFVGTYMVVETRY